MKILLKIMSFIIGFISGYQFGALFYPDITQIIHILSFDLSGRGALIAISCLCGFILGLILLFLLPLVLGKLSVALREWANSLNQVSIPQIGFSILGLLIALVLAALIANPILKLDMPDWIKNISIILIYGALAYIGLLLSYYKYHDFEAFFKLQLQKERERDREKKRERDEEKGDDEPKFKFLQSKKSAPSSPIIPKILDTSVIIDGRILDILKTGFVDGPILVPTFVLEELQFISDSSDSLKRNRGRRGLDILGQIQKELNIEVIISDKDYPELHEVDAKLLKLAQELHGRVVTNDYNLNKVAEVQGVVVLNTNELTNAVKTVVLPGESISVAILKEGKEHNQGIAYLEDGTMIVIEDGRRLLGKNANVLVTSVLQTSAGRMIFAKLA